PAQMMAAIELYRSGFCASEYLEKPRLMLGLNIVAADTDSEARRLFTSAQQGYAALRRGRLGQMPPPVDPDVIEAALTPQERADLQQFLSTAIVGSPDTVRAGLSAFLARTTADELIITGQIFDHAARIHSYEIVHDVVHRSEEVRN